MKGLACVSYDTDSPAEVWRGQVNVQGGIIGSQSETGASGFCSRSNPIDICNYNNNYKSSRGAENFTLVCHVVQLVCYDRWGKQSNMVLASFNEHHFP